MARPRKSAGSTTSSLTPGQASYVVERLIKERRVSQTDVNRYVSEMEVEISQLESRLQRLKDAAGAVLAPVAAAGAAGVAAVAVVRRARRGRKRAAAAAATAPATAPKGRRGRRKAAITPEQLASRQLQGRYLALVRRFPATKRAQYARIAQEKGREAAISDMQAALKK